MAKDLKKVSAELSVTELKAKIAEHEQTIAEQSTLIAEMMESNSKLSIPAKSGSHTVTVDGKVYPIMHKRFIAFGVEYTAEKLSKNPAFAKTLLDKKSPVLGAAIN